MNRPEMRSKDVLTVLGMLCIRPRWRAQFFENPRAKAQELVGILNDFELQQIDDLAGLGKLPREVSRENYVARLTNALDAICLAGNCPDPPCPKDPDDF